MTYQKEIDMHNSRYDYESLISRKQLIEKKYQLLVDQKQAAELDFEEQILSQKKVLDSLQNEKETIQKSLKNQIMEKEEIQRKIVEKGREAESLKGDLRGQEDVNQKELDQKLAHERHISELRIELDKENEISQGRKEGIYQCNSAQMSILAQVKANEGKYKDLEHDCRKLTEQADQVEVQLERRHAQAAQMDISVSEYTKVAQSLRRDIVEIDVQMAQEERILNTVKSENQARLDLSQQNSQKFEQQNADRD